MLNLFRSGDQSPPLIPPPDPGPDYAALGEILIVLEPPDAAGEITITNEEASRIREAGWSAGAGRWRAPLIPSRFISPYPLLRILDDQIDPAS